LGRLPPFSYEKKSELNVECQPSREKVGLSRKKAQHDETFNESAPAADLTQSIFNSFLIQISLDNIFLFLLDHIA
jgi:hypothetical protein